MGYPRIEKPHRFVCVCLFSPLEHASSMAKYLKNKFIFYLIVLSLNQAKPSRAALRAEIKIKMMV